MINTEKIIKNVLERKTFDVRESSNTQILPGIINLMVCSKANKDYALKHLYSKEISKHHKEGRIYIHTLHSAFKPYCNGIDTRIFLIDGLRFPHCKSKPSKHFSSAVYQSMAFLFYSQLFFAGAQAMDYYNWFLAPYVYYDKLKYKEVKQIIQGFVYQLNQANRVGAQSAFTNIGLRIKCPTAIKNEKIIFNGRFRNEKYAQFEKEARMIYKAFMEVLAEGDGSSAPFTFPLITTAITKKTDWKDDLIKETLRTASLKGSPYFLNLTTDYLDEGLVQAMCCRLLVEHSGGVWMAGGFGTGSNKVVTINLPHLSLISKNENDFFEKLSEELLIAKKALIQSNEIVKKSLNKWNLLPFLKLKTLKKHEGSELKYYDFKTRKLTIGCVGLNECLLNLIGKNIISEEGKKLGFKIIKKMRDACDKFSKETGTQFTLEQTPAESSSHYLATIDKNKFKNSHAQGTKNHYYYTNSTHIPYNKNIDLFEKVKIEAEYHPLFNGGTIFHVWMGESKPEIESMKKLVKRLSNTKLAYFTFSPDFSICSNNHVSRGKLRVCPICGTKIKDYMNRVVGFFTKTSSWNQGKKKEYQDRHRYKI